MAVAGAPAGAAAAGAAARGRALEFVDDEAVVALRGQDRRHAQGAGQVAVIVQDPDDRGLQGRGARVPAPAWTTRAALSGWSRPSGTITSGTPAASALITVPCAPWVTTAEQ